MTSSQTPFVKTALVIGATGGVGGAASRALIAHGWRIKALNRDPAGAQKRSPLVDIQWVKGDAMQAADVLAAAQGVQLIVHAANPPGYRDWDKLIIPMMQSSINAAKATGARIVLPGTVYNFGEDAGAVVTEGAPQNPSTRKGKLRVQMETILKDSDARALIVRAGDFFGPGATSNSWFSQFVKPGRPVRTVTYPGVRTVGHNWAYLPDLGETLAQLADREADLEAFAVFHFGGHWFEQGVDLAKSVRRVANIPNAPIRRFPWAMVIGLSPFVSTFKELLEMRYLWRRPVKLDNKKLCDWLGHEPHTPLDGAVAGALDALGCAKAAAPLRSVSPTGALRLEV